MAPRPAHARAARPVGAAALTTLGAWRRRPHSSVGSSSRPGPRLPRIGSVDAVALEERAATLAKRSIKRESKVQALELAVRMMDLTTLEGQDTPGKVAALCSKAMRPDPVDPSVPAVAAVCVYPSLVATAKGQAGGKRRQGRVGRDRLPVGAVAHRDQGRRDASGRRVRGRRGRHGDRPRRVPLRSLREGLRRDRAREGGVRRRAPQGHPRDGRARHVRQRPPCVADRDRGRRRLHQDLDGQGEPCGDAAGDALHDGGRPGRLRRDGPHRRDQARGRDPRLEAGGAVPGDALRDARRGRG